MASPRVMPNRDKGWYDRIGEKLTVRYRKAIKSGASNADDTRWVQYMFPIS